MNEELLEQAKLIVPDVRKLIVGVSRRARELAEGARTMVTVSPGVMSPEIMSLDNGRRISLRMIPRMGRAP